MDKLTAEYQKKFSDRLFFNDAVLGNVDPSATLHGESRTNPLSSAAACINVLGSLMFDKEDLKTYLHALGIPVTKVYEFPSGADVGGQKYNDRGCVVFEWVGPKESPST